MYISKGRSWKWYTIRRHDLKTYWYALLNQVVLFSDLSFCVLDINSLTDKGMGLAGLEKGYCKKSKGRFCSCELLSLSHRFLRPSILFRHCLIFSCVLLSGFERQTLRLPSVSRCQNQTAFKVRGRTSNTNQHVDFITQHLLFFSM